MLETRSSARSGVPLLAIAGVLWGTGGLLGEALARTAGIAPLAVAAVRLACGGLLLCLYLLGTGRRGPRTAAAWRRVCAFGVLAALFQGCYFAAVGLSSVSVATLVSIGTAPVVVLAVDSVRTRRLAAWPAGTVALALAGLALLVGPGDVGLAGAVLAALAGAGFATMTLLAARPVDGLDDATTIGVGFLAGGVALAPFVVASGSGFVASPAAFALLAALALVPTALAYTAYLSGLRTAPARVGAVMALLEPLTASVLAAVLLGDRLGVVGWVGAAVLATAVVLASSRSALVAVRATGSVGTRGPGSDRSST